MDNILKVKIRVYQGECGRKECSMERVSTSSQEGKFISVFGQMARFLLWLISDNFTSINIEDA